MSRLESRDGHKIAKIWADDQRRILLGGKVYADGYQVVDGWPQLSATSRWNEGDGGSYKAVKQHFPEVYSKEGLIVRRAIETMTERQRAILWAVYVEGRGRAKAGRFEIHCGRNVFYADLDHALTLIETMEKTGEVR